MMLSMLFLQSLQLAWTEEGACATDQHCGATPVKSWSVGVRNSSELMPRTETGNRDSSSG
jgi:hypothetical protein